MSEEDEEREILRDMERAENMRDEVVVKLEGRLEHVNSDPVRSQALVMLETAIANLGNVGIGPVVAGTIAIIAGHRAVMMATKAGNRRPLTIALSLIVQAMMHGSGLCGCSAHKQFKGDPDRPPTREEEAQAAALADSLLSIVSKAKPADPKPE